MLMRKRRGSVPVSDEAIAQRAYELWQSRGCPEGDGQEDWQDAKAQLLEEENRQRKSLFRLFSRLRNRAALA